MDSSTTLTEGSEIPLWIQLSRAHEDYTSDTSEHYDEVLEEVAERFAKTGSLGKADIGSLLLWKRLRADTKWARKLMNTSDLVVREATENVLKSANDELLTVQEAARKSRSALGALPGFTTGDALASAVIVAAAPKRMAIYDRRAHHGLTLLGIQLANSRGRYCRYMQEVQGLIQLLDEHDQTWSAREIDQALFALGNQR
ncbi:hypothetical protein ACTXL8_14385 [Glutamicibacter arilaitensis]|uniref:hypothetical protein n=1 Tax=Glutamicibacter arilaitensis TaxID=256701 RepID=UPI003F9CCC8E